MQIPAKIIGYCALAVLLALYVVGVVSNGIIRHIVKTLPLWVPILMGLHSGNLRSEGAA